MDRADGTLSPNAYVPQRIEIRWYKIKRAYGSETKENIEAQLMNKT